jgi:UDP-N-acetylglucosamine--N-acetylmuramyl-(pentapeptide) pyrophosphoryl-undecaprenol N-acetylglucosamine transferase
VSGGERGARAIAFTGGGSAGHVVPCLPLLDAFVARGWRVHYLGSKDGPEAALVAGAGHPFTAIPAGKLRRYWSWRNVTDVFRVLGGIVAAFQTLGRVAPAVVFSKGGFVAFPVVFAAWLRRIPVVAHESDLTPGLANRLSLPFCRVVCTNFPVTRFPGARSRIVHTGTPLRPALLAGEPARGRAAIGAPPGRPVLVVVGGSLGSVALNQAIRDALPALADWFVAHVCGPGRTVPALDQDGRYRQFEFIGAAWGDVLAAADVVLSRAGANALYELVALRKPHLLVPLPRSASRGDQIENAAHAEAKGWSRVLAEEAATHEAIAVAVRALYAERDAVAARMADAGIGDGTQAIVAVLLEVAQ